MDWNSKKYLGWIPWKKMWMSFKDINEYMNYLRIYSEYFDY